MKESRGKRRRREAVYQVRGENGRKGEKKGEEELG